MHIPGGSQHIDVPVLAITGPSATVVLAHRINYLPFSGRNDHASLAPQTSPLNL